MGLEGHVKREDSDQAAKQAHFSVDTHRSGVLSCRLLTTIEGKSRL
jgi:hypothetical protein